MIDILRGLRILEPQMRWFGPEVARMLETESIFYMRDIHGVGASSALKKTGWEYNGTPLCVPIVEEHGNTAVAAAWLTPTTVGLNLSYATASDYVGCGLSTLAAALVLVVYQNLNPGKDCIVHAQFDCENHGSLGVAKNLGMVESESMGFDVGEGPGTRSFVGAKAPLSMISPIARSIVWSRIYMRDETLWSRSLSANTPQL
jgi:hypothetical protein